MFLVAATLSAGAVLTVVALTSIRTVFRLGVIAIGAVALLPALLVVAALAAIAIVALLAAVVGDGDSAIGTDLARAAAVSPKGFVLRYYKALARQRHPVPLGIAVGLIVSTTISAFYVGLVIVPKETRTAAILWKARGIVEDAKRERGHFPVPGPGGELISSGVVGPLADAFGRPLLYVTQQGRLASRYRISSLGHDGQPSRDDLCIDGGSGLALWLRKVGSVAKVIDSLRPGASPRSESLAALEMFWCESPIADAWDERTGRGL